MLFRYPGGKTKLLHEINPRLDALLSRKKVLHDVFVGGGSVSLSVADRHRDVLIRMNDLDARISSFWSVVCGQDDGLDELCFRIESAVPTVEMFKYIRQQEKHQSSPVDLAFQALFLNRCSFSGLLHGNPIGGWNQTSEWTVSCRYNGKRLAKEIQATNELLKGRTTVYNVEASDYVSAIKNEPKYLDPPYYVKGGSLYAEQMKIADHTQLSSALHTARNWVLSYDDCPEVRELYSWASMHQIMAHYSVQGAKKKWSNKHELLIEPCAP